MKHFSDVISDERWDCFAVCIIACWTCFQGNLRSEIWGRRFNQFPKHTLIEYPWHEVEGVLLNSMMFLLRQLSDIICTFNPTELEIQTDHLLLSAVLFPDKENKNCHFYRLMLPMGDCHRPHSYINLLLIKDWFICWFEYFWWNPSLFSD